MDDLEFAYKKKLMELDEAIKQLEFWKCMTMIISWLMWTYIVVILTLDILKMVN